MTAETYQFIKMVYPILIHGNCLALFKKKEEFQLAVIKYGTYKKIRYKNFSNENEMNEFMGDIREVKTESLHDYYIARLNAKSLINHLLDYGTKPSRGTK